MYLSYYKDLVVIEKSHPEIFFCSDFSQIIRKASLLKRPMWSTAKNYNYEADFVNLISEIAIHRFLNLSAEESFEFVKQKIAGANSLSTKNGKTIILKSTKNASLRYKFGETYDFKKKSDDLVFFTVLIPVENSVAIQFLGYASKFKLEPWVKKSKDKRKYIALQPLIGQFLHSLTCFNEKYGEKAFC